MDVRADDPPILEMAFRGQKYRFQAFLAKNQRENRRKNLTEFLYLEHVAIYFQLR